VRGRPSWLPVRPAASDRRPSAGDSLFPLRHAVPSGAANDCGPNPRAV